MLAPGLANGDGTDASYALDALVAAQDSHFWFRARNELIAWAMSRYFPAAGSFLDLGCGTGGVSAALRTRFPHLRLVASDVLASGLERAHRRLKDVALIQMDGRNLPFDSESTSSARSTSSSISMMTRGLQADVPGHAAWWGRDHHGAAAPGALERDRRIQPPPAPLFPEGGVREAEPCGLPCPVPRHHSYRRCCPCCWPPVCVSRGALRSIR